MPRADIVVYRIGELVSFNGAPLSGVNAGNAGILHGSGIAVRDGVVVEVGSSDHIKWRYTADALLDAEGLLVTPGLVDIHTHPVFTGSRADELELKLEGVRYEEILARGGGIYRTIESTARASEEELLERLEKLARFMMHGGTTTVEMKTGYGLDLNREYRHLVILNRLRERTSITIVPTLLAHVPPREGDRRSYVEGFKALASRVGIEGLASYIDVFCDEGAFTVEETREIIGAGLGSGLRARIHADQIRYIGCSSLALEMRIDSVEHLENTPPSGVEAIARSGSIAGLLPTSILSMMKPDRPPVGELRRRGVPIAVGSDYNANNQTPLVQTAVQVAPYILGLTQIEALAGATYIAAHSLGLADRGRIAPGMRADIIAWSVGDYREIGYKWGYNMVWGVIVGGKQVVWGEATYP